MEEHLALSSNAPAAHQPVLLGEFLQAANPQPGQRWIDATFGRGGHAAALLARGAQVLGIDQDPAAAQAAESLRVQYPQAFRHVQANFSQMTMLAQARGWDRVEGVLLDLGVSSPQLDEAGRGFSVRLDGPLDMRMNPASGKSAAELVNTASEAELVEIFVQYGDERAADARRLARAIVRERQERPFATTGQLADLIEAKTHRGKGRKGHPATRVFQALRIAVNGEMAALEAALPQAAALLAPGGVLACISFHSGEDRRVKRFLQENAGRALETDGPELPARVRAALPEEKAAKHFEKLARFLPSAAEMARNPRSRSARLRVGWRSALPWSPGSTFSAGGAA